MTLTKIEPSHLPKQIFSEWITVLVPDTNLIATYPIPAELTKEFIDYVSPPTILFFCKSVMETTARLFCSSDNKEIIKHGPDKKIYKTLTQQVKIWIRKMMVIHVNRKEKKSRVLKFPESSRCSMSHAYINHPDWADWPTEWPNNFVKNQEEQKRFNDWLKVKGTSQYLRLVKPDENKI
jgi:hypothetical protein